MNKAIYNDEDKARKGLYIMAASTSVDGPVGRMHCNTNFGYASQLTNSESSRRGVFATSRKMLERKEKKTFLVQVYKSMIKLKKCGSN